MGLKNIKPFTKEWKDDYGLEFHDNSYGGGYCFSGEVDEAGLFTLHLKETARESFLSALEKVALGGWDSIKVVNYGWWVKTPAHGTCACGREVWLERDYGHGIDCECGRIYNQSGDELAPRSQWDDRYSEESTQPYCVEFGYAGDEY